MAIKLLVVLVVLALAQGLPDLARMRDFSRLRVWVALLGRRGDVLQSFLALVVPVALCALLQWWLSGPLFGLLGVAFAVCVLWFAWGPREPRNPALPHCCHGTSVEMPLVSLEPFFPCRL